jgi:hypothetical protein
VGGKAGRQGTAPGAPGTALGEPGSPGVDPGGQGTVPGAPGVALCGPVNPGVGRGGPGWARPGVLGRWGWAGAGCPYAGGSTPGWGWAGAGCPYAGGSTPGWGWAGAGCPYAGGTGLVGVTEPGALVLPEGTPGKGAGTCWAMLLDTAPRASPSRSIPRTHRYIHTQRQCDTASSSHLCGYTCTIAHESSKIWLYRLGSLEQELARRGMGNSLLSIRRRVRAQNSRSAVTWRSPGC